MDLLLGIISTRLNSSVIFNVR